MIQALKGFTGGPTVTSAADAVSNGRLTSSDDQKLKDSAKALEGLFVQQLFKAMRDTVPQQEGIVSGGAGEEIFTGLLDEHLAAETPQQWEGGLAEAVYRQLRGATVGASGNAASQASSSSPASNTP